MLDISSVLNCEKKSHICVIFEGKCFWNQEWCNPAYPMVSTMPHRHHPTENETNALKAVHKSKSLWVTHENHLWETGQTQTQTWICEIWVYGSKSWVTHWLVLWGHSTGSITGHSFHSGSKLFTRHQALALTLPTLITHHPSPCAHCPLVLVSPFIVVPWHLIFIFMPLHFLFIPPLVPPDFHTYYRNQYILCI